MATVIAFVFGEFSDGRQMEILTEVRSRERALRLLKDGVRRRERRSRVRKPPRVIT